MNYPIEVKNLTKVYSNNTVALKDADLKIKKGEIFGFIGPNGAGKTTLIKLIMGLLKPTEGKSFLNGKDSFLDDPSARVGVGYLPAEIDFDNVLTVKEILDLTKKLKNTPEFDYNDLVDYFELPLNIKFKELSTGNKKKLGLVNALIGNPEILVLDEPTTGLDPLMQKKFITKIKEINKKSVTIFLSSHILSEITHLVDRLSVIKEGEIISIESMAHISKNNHKIITIRSENFKIDKRKKLYKNVKIISNKNNELKFDFVGNLNDLIAEVAKFNIENIEIKDVDVESYFLNFYN